MNLDPFIHPKIVFFSNFIQEFSEKNPEKENLQTAKSAVVTTKTLFHQFPPFRQFRYPAIPLKKPTSIDRM